MFFIKHQGLDYLHKSPIRCHGYLKSTNCLVDSRWVVKLNSWGLSSLHQQVDHDNEEDYYTSMQTLVSVVVFLLLSLSISPFLFLTRLSMQSLPSDKVQ